MREILHKPEGEQRRHRNNPHQGERLQMSPGVPPWHNRRSPKGSPDMYFGRRKRCRAILHGIGTGITIASNTWVWAHHMLAFA